MSLQAIAILALIVIALLGLFVRKSRKPKILTGSGEACLSCDSPFPPEMLDKVKQVTAAQVQQTMAKFPGQKVSLKLKVKMTCPKCKAVSEIEAPVVS